MGYPSNLPTHPMEPHKQPRCSTCGRPRGQKGPRADQPPVNMIDFADRQLQMVAGSQWNWRIPLRIAAVTGAATTPPVTALVVGAVVVWRQLADISTLGALVLMFLASTMIIGVAISRTGRR